MSESVKDLFKSIFYVPAPADAPVRPPVDGDGPVKKGIAQPERRTPSNGGAGRTGAGPQGNGARPQGGRAPANTGYDRAGSDDPTRRLPSQPERKHKERRSWFRGSGSRSDKTFKANQPARSSGTPAPGDRRGRPYPDGSDVFPGNNPNGAPRRPAYQIDDFAEPVRSPSARGGRVINMQGSDIGMGPPIREYIPKKMEDKAKGTKMHYGEYKHVIDDFAAGNIIILNLQNLDTGADEEKNKVLCLIFGAIAAVDGYIYMLSDNIYLFAMGGVDVSGALGQGRVGDFMPGL